MTHPNKNAAINAARFASTFDGVAYAVVALMGGIFEICKVSELRDFSMVIVAYKYGRIFNLN